MDQLPTAAVADVRSQRKWLRFRLIHIAYIVTLLACSMALFGPLGLPVGGVIGAFWASVFISRSRPKMLLPAMVAAFLCCCLIVELLRLAGGGAGHAGRQPTCWGNLKTIGLALHSYHDVHGSFPPAYIADADGTPKHSWRVLLLPYLDQQSLYDKYDFDEPWNGPNNSQLMDNMPSCYGCPAGAARRKGQTSYVAVVGPDTAWPSASARTIAGITDGISTALQVLECDDQEIGWLEPVDLEFDEAVEMLAVEDTATARRHHWEDVFYQYSAVGRNAIIADASPVHLNRGVRREACAALLTVNDGAGWRAGDLMGVTTVSRHINAGGWLRLGTIVVLTVLPLPWVWLNPRSKPE